MARPATPQQLATLVQEQQAAEAAALEEQTAQQADDGAGAELAGLVAVALAAWVAAFGALAVLGVGAKLAGLLAGVRADMDRASKGMGRRAQLALEGALDEATRLGGRHAVDFLRRASGRDHDLPDLNVSRDVAEAAAHLSATVAEQMRLAARLLSPRVVSASGWRGVILGLAAARRAATLVRQTIAWVIHRAINDGAAQVADHYGARGMWVTEPDACVICLAYAGRLADRDGRFPGGLSMDPQSRTSAKASIDGPPLHPNCLVGSMRVSGPVGVMAVDEALRLSLDPTLRRGRLDGDLSPFAAAAVAEAVGDFGRSNIGAASVREYIGQVVTIRTASGKELTGTPNHPVATRSGWVALAELQVGDHVLSSTRPEWEANPVDPDVDHVPPRIEDVAKSFTVALGPVPLAPEDFHGDGSGSDVCVVRTDGLLLDDFYSAPAEVARKSLFGGGDVPPGLGLDSLGMSGQFLRAALVPPPGSVRGRRKTLSLLRLCLAHTQVHRITATSWLNPSAYESAADRRAADAEGFCENLFALSGEIAADEIVSVNVDAFAGHVYNLETSEGWYIGNGIVTHNCRCRIVPWMPDWDTGPGTLPDLLRDQAWRSIATGRGRPTESRAARRRAAQALLAQRGLSARVRRQAQATAAGRT